MILIKILKLLHSLFFLFLLCPVIIYSQTLPHLHLISPNGGEKLEANTVQSIKWESSGIQNIKIEYSLSGGLDWVLVEQSVDAYLKEYFWKVADAQTPYVLIRISDVSDSGINDVSDDEFTILIKSSTKKSEIIKRQNNNSVTTVNSTPIKIMPLGNSITWGVNPDASIGANDPNAEGYRRYLFQLLSPNYNIHFVGSLVGGSHTDFDRNNEGHSGMYAYRRTNSSLSMRDNLPTYLSSNPPDVILLHIGTNDFGSSLEPKSNDSIAHDVTKLLDIIKSFNSNINTHVARIINRSDNAALHDSTSNFNLKLQSRVNTLITSGQNVLVVNMESQLNYPGDLSSDLLHPKDAGYQKIANTWYAALQSYLPVLRLRVFLQGPYSSSNTMTTSLNRSDLHSSPYTSDDSKTVSYTVPDSITDWVLVQIRQSDKTTILKSKSCFLSNHGYVIDPNGLSTNISLGISPGNYYVVVKHRNHLAVMSSDLVELDGLTSYDFTTAQTQAYSTSISIDPMANLGGSPVKFGMFAGDANGDGLITTLDYNAWLPNARATVTGYTNTDINLDGQNTTLDYNLWLPNARAARNSQVP